MAVIQKETNTSFKKGCQLFIINPWNLANYVSEKKGKYLAKLFIHAK